MKYLLELFKLSADDLLSMISDGLKKPITKEEIFRNEIKVSILKRIDKVFEKGLHFYLDPKAPEKSKEASIFFRKEKFGIELNIGAKKIVNHFEDFKISLSAIAKLSDIDFKRQIEVYNIHHSPRETASEIRKILYPDFEIEKREFLKGLITKFASANILVFEFVETWNKKEKANIDGFFLKPNVIVVKRNQSAMRREIFTLAHELGHYLLKEEEVEEFDYNRLLNKELNAVERWCNDFAYYFLAGKYADSIDKLEIANADNDYHHEMIANISKRTHLSQTALYTRLLFQNLLSKANYFKIKSGIEAGIKARQEAEKLKREQDILTGKPSGGSTPKAINSPLLISTIQSAFYEGVINEYEVCKSLNIKPENLDIYIQ
ncbi:MAG TPA: ImmA/IrrE family metallo-endopeptidase [Hanamia sp.]|nr:ImmA/IrrE family metallo-endopeptidase [Hanamia sp.]